MLKRDKGSPCSYGSSQARALMAITTLGGKAPRPPVPRSFVEPLDPLFEESLAPLADDLRRGVEPCRDLLVLHTVGGIQDDLGADYVTIR